MINSFSKFLKKADQFGANYKPSFAHGEVQFKTSLGGLISITLYGVSLAYLIYEVFLWRTGQMLPKVTSMATEIETYTLNFEQVAIAEFCLRRHKNIENQIDPFDPKNVVLLPMLYQVIDDELQSPKPLLSTTLSTKHETIQIELKQIKLVNSENPELGIKNVEYIVMFEECNSDVLPSGWTCASEDRVKEFFSQKQNQLYIRTFVNQYNTSTKQIDLIEQDYYASFDNKTTYFSQLTLLTSNVSVDTGFLFESIVSYEFPSSISQYVQQMDLDYFTHIFERDVFVVMEFELGTLQQTTFIEYPKVSEVLANIGSIISFFLFFSNVAYMLNEKSLEDKIVGMVIEMYYPQLKDVKFIKNWYRKVVNASYKNKPLTYFGQFQQKYKELQSVARQKLCLTNQLYEISRLQFIFRSFCDGDVLLSSHSMGISLKELEITLEPDKSELINNQPQGLQVENLEDRSVDEMNKIAPQVTLDVPQIQSSVINFDKIQQSQSIFLGKQLQQQSYSNNGNDNLQLSEEEFYILMQNQQEYKNISTKKQSTMNLHQTIEMTEK